jgi:Protein of unknown function (DUF2721)
MLSYTNRFLAISSLIRKLYADFEDTHKESLLSQIKNLRLRVYLIRWAQFSAIMSMLFCTVTMFFVYLGWQETAKGIFGISLLLMILSLLLCIWEIFLSADALKLLLIDLEKKEKGL